MTISRIKTIMIFQIKIMNMNMKYSCIIFQIFLIFWPYNNERMDSYSTVLEAFGCSWFSSHLVHHHHPSLLVSGSVLLPLLTCCVLRCFLPLVNMSRREREGLAKRRSALPMKALIRQAEIRDAPLVNMSLREREGLAKRRSALPMKALIRQAEKRDAEARWDNHILSGRRHTNRLRSSSPSKRAHSFRRWNSKSGQVGLESLRLDWPHRYLAPDQN